VDIIKENMFFVVMGAVVLLALALFLVLVQPIKSENAARESDVRNLLSSLTRLEDKKKKDEMPNEVAITAGKAYSKAYEEQLQALIDELSKMQLSTDLPGLDPGEKDAPGAFKTVYQKDVEQLKRRLDEKRITLGTDVWYFWDWGDGVPKQAEQRELATKEFSLMRELIEIIASPELRVMQLDHLEVNQGETRTGDFALSRGGPTVRLRVEPYFDVFPFVLEIRMPFQKYELLLRDLLTSKKEIPIYIRTVSMMRLEDDPRVYKQMPTLYIGIRVTGWALDYRPQERRPTVPSGPTGPPTAYGGPAAFEGGSAR